MLNKILDRRNFIRVSLVGVAALLVRKGDLLATNALAADMPLASPDDQQAKALGYVEDAKKLDLKKYPNVLAKKAKNPTCANCMFYPDKDKPQGACQLMPGKAVKAAALCGSWNLRPGA